MQLKIRCVVAVPMTSSTDLPQAAFITVDAYGSIERCDTEVCRMSGYAEKDLINRAIHIIFPFSSFGHDATALSSSDPMHQSLVPFGFEVRKGMSSSNIRC